ncbi:MAG: formylmethanofuran dehydrogenase subunit C [Pirellulaceae bacterium]
MPLTLSLQHDITTTLDLRPVDPNKLREMSVDKIKRLLLWQGNQQVELGQLFALRGTADDAEVHLEGDFRKADYIGQGLSGGSLHVRGSVGNHAGQSMTGGSLHIEGDAGDLLAEDLLGGTIQVTGNAGNRVGTPLPGNRRGMQGGTVCIQGNVGREVGQRMRRGLLLVGGDTDILPGHEMLAGTLVILGQVGAHPGLRMKRGTLICPRLDRQTLPATFHHDGRFRLPMMPQLLRQAATCGLAAITSLEDRTWDQYSGDAVHFQRGEILVPCGE